LCVDRAEFVRELVIREHATEKLESVVITEAPPARGLSRRGVGEFDGAKC
jgi:hypothetical protein